MHTKRAPIPRRHRGLTLVELAVVVAVVGIAASVAVPGLRDLVDSRRLIGTAARLAADVQFARSEAVSRNRTLRLGFQSIAGASCYVVHTGAAGQCRCALAGPAACTGGAAEIKTVVLADADRVTVDANVASMVFDPRHGTITPAATLRTIDARGRAVHHVVNVMGRVRSCSPGAAVAGFRAC